MKVSVAFYPDAPRGFPMEQDMSLENNRHYNIVDILKLIIAEAGNGAGGDLIEQGQSGAVYIFVGNKLVTDLSAAEVSDGSKISIVIPAGGG